MIQDELEGNTSGDTELEACCFVNFNQKSVPSAKQEKNLVSLVADLVCSKVITKPPTI